MNIISISHIQIGGMLHYLTHTWGGKRVYTFPLGRCQKVKAKAPQDQSVFDLIILMYE